MDEDSSDSKDGTYAKQMNSKRRPVHKRQKLNAKRAMKTEQAPEQSPKEHVSFQPLLDLVEWHDMEESGTSFEDFVTHSVLPEFLSDRDAVLARESEVDSYGQTLRPLTRSEVSTFLEAYLSTDSSSNPLHNIMLRKLKLRRQRGLAGVSEAHLSAPPDYSPSTHLTSLPRPHPAPPVNPAVIDALYAIRTTPYLNSFASRLYGHVLERGDGQAIAMDWQTRSPWMELMTDIRDHYSFAHPEREQLPDCPAPISYTCLQAHHLRQVHDILERVFWAGVDVTDSLQYTPEKSTVIATYKHLVVGVAILSSPQETYITYLAVRTGWDNSQIATSMLYHLIQLNPNKDITLHVSTNNPAMLLYNRFGFKAEEFVAGFYEDYLDPQSRASKNAFRLRLRR